MSENLSSLLRIGEPAFGGTLVSENVSSRPGGLQSQNPRIAGPRTGEPIQLTRLPGAGIFGPFRVGPDLEKLKKQQKERFQKDLVTAQEAKVKEQRRQRNRNITRRAAGPQTLFSRSRDIPRAVNLGGGRR